MRMKTIEIGVSSLLIALLTCGPAAAWASANAYGGHSSGTYGQGATHTNTYGGSTSHSYYGGTSHTNAYGGTTSGAYGEGAVHTNTYGQTTAYHPPTYGGAYYHPPTAYYPYHPPTTVNYYGSSCGSCGGWAVVAGMAIGASAAKASSSAATSSAYSAGVAAGSASTAAATSSAYSAGVAAGVTAATTTYAMGAIYATLPAGAVHTTINNTTYFVANGTWFVAASGANGVYYTVVPAP